MSLDNTAENVGSPLSYVLADDNRVDLAQGCNALDCQFPLSLALASTEPDSRQLKQNQFEVNKGGGHSDPVLYFELVGNFSSS